MRQPINRPEWVEIDRNGNPLSEPMPEPPRAAPRAAPQRAPGRATAGPVDLSSLTPTYLHPNHLRPTRLSETRTRHGATRTRVQARSMQKPAGTPQVSDTRTLETRAEPAQSRAVRPVSVSRYVSPYVVQNIRACEQCGNEIDATMRAGTKFCSPNCRLIKHRNSKQIKATERSIRSAMAMSPNRNSKAMYLTRKPKGQR